MILTPYQLASKLGAVAQLGTSIVQLETNTKPEMLVRGNPYLTARKKCSINVVLNAMYEDAVNKQGKKENNPLAGEFKSNPLPWGEFVYGYGRTLITYKGNLYLRVQVANNPPEVKYELGDGTTLDYSKIKPFLKRSKPRKQHEFGNTKPVVIRTFKLENIKRIKINHLWYEIAS